MWFFKMSKTNKFSSTSNQLECNTPTGSYLEIQWLITLFLNISYLVTYFYLNTNWNV